MVRVCASGLALLLAVAVPALAHAQAPRSAIVIAVGGSPDVPQDQWMGAELSAARELGRRGLEVPSDGIRLREDSPADCHDDACFEQVRTEAGVAVLCAVSVFEGADTSGNAGSVVITLRDEHGTYAADAAFEALDATSIDTTVRRALSVAFEEQSRGGQPWLTLRGSPEGALVVIDGVERGVLPWEGPLAAGEHHIEVRLGGYVALDERRSVVAGRPTVIDVALARQGGGSVDVGWVVAGSVSALVGLTALGIGIGNATDTTRCLERCSDPAPRYHVADTGPAIGLAVGGGVALVLGVVGLILGLTSSGAQAGSVSLRADGLHVRF